MPAAHGIQALTLLGDGRPEAVLADKGYDTDPILNALAERGIQAVIPPRSLRKVQRSFDCVLYRQRNRIERTFSTQGVPQTQYDDK